MKPLLVEVRGAGGSGKSTIVRRIMARYSAAEPYWPELPVTFDSLKRGVLRWDGRSIRPAAEGLAPGAARQRSRPSGYILRHPAGGPDLFVTGHYGTECGGTDTIPSVDLTYHIARGHMEYGRNVLQEGRLLSWADNQRPLAMPGDLLAVCLEQTLEACVGATLRRRAARGAETTESKRANIEKNARREIKSVQSAGRRLAEAGREVAWCSRDEALALVAERLGVRDAPERPLGELGIGIEPPSSQASLFA